MKKILKNNLFFKLIALIAAIIIWYIIINVDNPLIKVVIKDVPVQIMNADSLQNKNKVFSLDNNSRVDVLIEGRRTVVGNIKDDDISALVDLSKVSLFNTVEVKIKFKDESLDAVIFNPIRLINISVENKIEAPFPITIVPIGKVIEGYAVSSTDAMPSEIKVSGAESVIKKIKEIRGEIDVTGANNDVVSEVKIIAYDEDEKPVKENVLALSKTVIRARANIGKVKTIPINLLNLSKPSDGYSIGDVIITPNNIDIIGDSNQMLRTTSIDISYETTELSKLEKQTVTGSINLEKYLPKGIRLANSIDKVSVQIVINETKEKDIKINSSDIEIRPDNNNVEFIDKIVEGVILGTKTELDKIEDIKELKPYILVDTTQDGEQKVSIKFDTNINIETRDLYIKVKIKKENYAKKNSDN